MKPFKEERENKQCQEWKGRHDSKPCRPMKLQKKKCIKQPHASQF